MTSHARPVVAPISPLKSFVTSAGIAMLGATLAACGGATYDPSAAPTPSNAEATTQVTRLFEGVMNKDQADLEKFLAPNFVLQRTTGAGLDRNAYIAGIPDLDSYKLDPITGSQYGDTLTATYSARTDLIVDGKKFPSAPSPYLSTFVRIDGEWHLVSHGNFAVPR